jgi:hypothetical protein
MAQIPCRVPPGPRRFYIITIGCLRGFCEGRDRNVGQQALSRPPMVRNLLVIEVPDASDKGMVTIRLRPIDSCSLSCESAEDMIRVVFDHVIVNVRSFRAALGTGFYINIRHSYFLALYSVW